MYFPDTTAPEQLTETSRLRVKYDTDASNPRDDGYMVTGALTVSGPRNEIDVLTVYGFPGDLEHAHNLLEGDAVRWARVFHDITLVWDQARGTYWWADPEQMKSNWPELTVGSDEYVAKEREVIESEQWTYSTWCDGDVYGVILERAVEWRRVSDEGASRMEWEEADALWGCYLGEKYTAKQVAAESFDLTEDELAACKQTD
jgi:hypothetical protein